MPSLHESRYGHKDDPGCAIRLSPSNVIETRFVKSNIPTGTHHLTHLSSEYDKSSWDVSSTLSYQRIVEAMKYSYGQRMTLGDPAFDPIVNQVREKTLNQRI